MMQLSSLMANLPVLSLRTGQQISTALTPIINPNNLKIEGFYCKSEHNNLALLSQDIRDILPDGIVVNDVDALIEPEELVRFKNIIGFTLIGKRVITNDKKKLGRVNDYATETSSLYVKKLYVTPPFFKSFNGGNLIIDRTQIIEITDKKIVINDLEASIPVSAGAVA